MVVTKNKLMVADCYVRTTL